MNNNVWQEGRPETVYDAFVQAERCHGERPFLCVLPEVAGIYGIPPGELTYSAARAQVESLASRFAAAGYGRGHRIGLLLENRPAYFLTWFALNALGASVVPINPDLRASELQYLIGHSDITAAVVLPARKDDIAAAAGASGKAVAVMSPDDDIAPASTTAATVRPALGRNEECAVLY